MKLNKTTILSFFILLLPIFLNAQDYNFYGSMTREKLSLYLSKAISMSSLIDETSCYSPPCVASSSTFYDPINYNANINMLVDIDARFIGRACNMWGGEWVINAGYFNNVAKVVSDITTAYTNANKTKPIVQAAIFEIVTPQVSTIQMTDEVANKFGITKRNFNYLSMCYPDWATNPNHLRGDGFTNGIPNSAIPDMNQIETQMWFYYLATQYINNGIEALHLGAFSLMTDNDPNHQAWWSLLTKIRNYAATKNRGIVLCDAHTPFGEFLGSTNQLLFDFHSSPIRPIETPPHWPLPATNGGPTLLEYNPNCGTVFGRMKGGKTYFGWETPVLPYLVELDNYGMSNHPNVSGDCWNPWGWDEITWFADQTEKYRNDWLKYAYYTTKLLDSNAFFQMPGRRPISDGSGIWLYRALPGYHNQASTIKELWSGKYDISVCAPNYYLNNYFNNCSGANCWNENTPRFLGDVNGDGKSDIIGFGNNGVYVSYSTGTSFSIPSLVINDFSYQNGNGWNVINNPRLIGDVNGDGKVDIVGFGNNGVYLSLSNGNGFSAPSLVLQDYNYNNGLGWTFNHPRFLADVNGDGKKDIIGFGNAGVYVSYSTGTGFTGGSLKLSEFGYNYGNGWKIDQTPRLIGDVNGDGKADIVGFANNGVMLSLSTGNGYTTPSLVLQDFNYNNGVGWTSNHPRFLADVNGDGKDDIIGFGNDGVYIAYSTGSSFTGGRIAIKNYGYEYGNGWNFINNPRLIGHVNSDNKADIVGFGNTGTYISTSIGDQNSNFAIMSPPKFYPEYGYNNGNGWLPNKHPRLLGDIDGDGKDEIVGFGYSGVYVMNCGLTSTAFRETKIETKENFFNEKNNEIIKIYPNPSSGTITIQFSHFRDNSVNYYYITNSFGIKIAQGEIINNQTTRINLSSQGKGLYLISISAKNGEIIQSGKIVIQ